MGPFLPRHSTGTVSSGSTVQDYSVTEQIHRRGGKPSPGVHHGQHGIRLGGLRVDSEVVPVGAT